MIHFFTINKETFGKMKKLEQLMEYGLLDEKKQKLKSGDTIVFEDSTDNKQLIARVIGLYTARTFFDLRIQLFMAGLIDYNSIEPKELTEKFGKEEVEKYGVVACSLFFDNELRVTGRKYNNYVAYEKKFYELSVDTIAEYVLTCLIATKYPGRTFLCGKCVNNSHKYACEKLKRVYNPDSIIAMAYLIQYLRRNITRKEFVFTVPDPGVLPLHL